MRSPFQPNTTREVEINFRPKIRQKLIAYAPNGQINWFGNGPNLRDMAILSLYAPRHTPELPNLAITDEFHWEFYKVESRPYPSQTSYTVSFFVEPEHTRHAPTILFAYEMLYG